ncbi:MAG: hypothetical protein ACLU8D_01585 [Enterocloster sp.]
MDLEPRELLERLRNGPWRKRRSIRRERIFYGGKSDGLREVALRRCADRINMLTRETELLMEMSTFWSVCRHPPSNAKIVRTAARMANAFRGALRPCS